MALPVAIVLSIPLLLAYDWLHTRFSRRVLGDRILEERHPLRSNAIAAAIAVFIVVLVLILSRLRIRRSFAKRED